MTIRPWPLVAVVLGFQAIVVGCEDEPKPYAIEAPMQEDRSCEKKSTVPVTFFQPDGVWANMEYYDCPRPFSGDKPYEFTDNSGSLAVVTGIAAELRLHWDGPGDLKGRNLTFWYADQTTALLQSTMGLQSGYYVIEAPSNDNPLVLPMLPMPGVVDGRYGLQFAIDGGDRNDPTDPELGNVFGAAFFIIEVGTGDIQINLNWATLTDMDLAVIDPAGEEIFYANKTSASGGELDLDSYPGCFFSGDRGQGNENIFWEAGGAPPGRYTVLVTMYDECGTFVNNAATEYTVNVIIDGEVETFEGIFEQGDRTGEAIFITSLDY